MQLPIIKTLKNGLRVCLQPNKEQYSIAIQLRGFAGSNYETLKNIGAAHFLEHWILKGSKSFSSEANLTAVITENGGKYIGITSREDVLLGVHILKEDLDNGLKFLSEIFYKPNLTKHSFNLLKRTIKAEITRTYDNPEKLVARLAYATLFPNTRLTKFNLGDINDLNKLSANAVRNFFERHYTNDNFVLCLTGNFDSKQTLKKIAKYFNKKTSISKKRSLAKIQISKKENVQIHTGYKFKQEYLRVDYDGFKFSDPKKYSAIILAKCLSTLIREETAKKGITYKTSVDSFSAYNYGFFSFYGSCDKQNVNALLHIFNVSLANHKTLITQNLLESSKKAIIANLLFSLEKPSMQASYFTELLLYGIKKPKLAHEIQKIKSISLENIYSTASIVLRRNKKVTLLSSKSTS